MTPNDVQVPDEVTPAPVRPDLARDLLDGFGPRQD